MIMTDQHTAKPGRDWSREGSMEHDVDRAHPTLIKCGCDVAVLRRGLTSTELGVKVARSMSVWTPRRGTYTLTMVSLCSQEHVVSTRKLSGPMGPTGGPWAAGPGAPGAKPAIGQPGLNPLPARAGCTPGGGIHAAAVTVRHLCLASQRAAERSGCAQISAQCGRVTLTRLQASTKSY